MRSSDHAANPKRIRFASIRDRSKSAAEVRRSIMSGIIQSGNLTSMDIQMGRSRKAEFSLADSGTSIGMGAFLRRCLPVTLDRSYAHADTIDLLAVRIIRRFFWEFLCRCLPGLRPPRRRRPRAPGRQPCATDSATWRIASGRWRINLSNVAGNHGGRPRMLTSTGFS